MVKDAHGKIPSTIVFFDGYCHLCSRTVQWVIRFDRPGHIHFASLDSQLAERLIPSSYHDLDSIVLLDDGIFYTQSDAVIGILRKLHGLRVLASLVALIPKPWRDRVYNFVARHRTGWFGRRNTCWLPSPEHTRRFLKD